MAYVPDAGTLFAGFQEELSADHARGGLPPQAAADKALDDIVLCCESGACRWGPSVYRATHRWQGGLGRLENGTRARVRPRARAARFR